MERVVKFLKDAEVFYFKNATATFSAFTRAGSGGTGIKNLSQTAQTKLFCVILNA